MSDSGQGTVVRGNFVLLRAQELRLVLAQHEVGMAEHVDDVPRPTAQAGVFEAGHAGQSLRVVALSAHLRPLAQFPPDRFVLTRLHTGDEDLSYAWNEARVLIDAKLERKPLPPVMRVEGAPIEAFVEHEGDIYLCTTAARVAAWAGLRGG